MGVTSRPPVGERCTIRRRSLRSGRWLRRAGAPRHGPAFPVRHGYLAADRVPGLAATLRERAAAVAARGGKTISQLAREALEERIAHPR